MLRPETARLFTTMLLWNIESNSVAQPTGQLAPGLAMVESPAIQTVFVVTAAAAALSTGTLQSGAATAAAEAVAGGTRDSGITRKGEISRGNLRIGPPVGDGGP